MSCHEGVDVNLERGLKRVALACGAGALLCGAVVAWHLSAGGGPILSLAYVACADDIGAYFTAGVTPRR